MKFWPPVVLVLLAACRMGPDFTPPEPPVPAGWTDAVSPTSAGEPDLVWWRRFDDPVLTGLVERARAGNLDLKEAVLRVTEARLQAAVARGAGLPTLSASGSYEREVIVPKGLINEFGVGPNGPLAPLVNGISQPIDLFEAGFDASWELDLFGRVARSVEEADASAAYTLETRHDAEVTLEGEVASTYLQLRGAQAERAALDEMTGALKGRLDLDHRLIRDGLLSEIDADAEAADLSQTESRRAAYDASERNAMNRLAVLVGDTPGALTAELTAPTALPPVPADLPAGLPGSLIRRRPDIRGAEAQLHAATADIGVAVAALFPDISLTGQVAFRAERARHLADWSNLFYGIGPQVSLPIFEGGRLRDQVLLARAEQARLALDYRRTVLAAFEEVEDGLTACRTTRDRRQATEAAERYRRDALDLTADRARHGLASEIAVLAARRSLADARDQMIQARLAEALDVVTLYKALGGGWRDEVPPG